jgi:DNA-binding response OmpR family regulator
MSTDVHVCIGPAENDAVPAEPSAPLVLAIEDDAAIRAVYAELLTEEGFRVVTWGSVPAEGPTAVAALAPDLVILDLVIGQQPAGWALLAALHADPTTTRIPALIVTVAGILARDHAAELDAWGCGVLLKPFDLDDFVAAVRNCLSPGRNRAAS